MELFSFPLRLTPSGRIATVTQGTDQADAEAVGMLLLTRVGERPLVPSFGIPDPMFHAVSEHDVVAAVHTFLPDVVVGAVTVIDNNDRTQQVNVQIGAGSAQP